MTSDEFDTRLGQLPGDYEQLIALPNEPEERSNGVLQRWKRPVLTAAHTPVFWRYDLDRKTNPFLMEGLGINAVFNPGAMDFDGRHILMARIEGCDRKSFFAVAESSTGVDGFRFWDYPVVMPETEDPDAVQGDLSSAIAQCGIARTRDLRNWERLADLKTRSPQQRIALIKKNLPSL